MASRKPARANVLSGDVADIQIGTAAKGRSVSVRTKLGTARGIESTDAKGIVTRVMQIPSVPFLCVQQIFRNRSRKPVTVETLKTVPLRVESPAPMQRLRAVGCDGLSLLDKPKVSYAWAAAGDTLTRAGVVAGWVSQERASGIVKISAGKKALSIRARADYGPMTLEPGAELTGEMLVVGVFDDVLEGLEAYADAVAAWHKVDLRPVPSGYCTWYHSGPSNEKDVTALAKFCRDNALKDYGLEFIQIDDGWQISRRDFTSDNPEGPFPSGMAALSKTIRNAGFTAGIWYTPFGWDHTRDVFQKHQDWFVHKPSGKVYDVFWGGDCFDMTHPGARKFLADVVAHWSKDCGYKYIKIDALWTGLAARIRYQDRAVGPDYLTKAVFHDPHASNVEAFRTGLRTVRKAAGKDVFVLGCTVSQNLRTLAGSYGLVDGIRVGLDIGAAWEAILPCAAESTRQYFLNARVWWNDPDCLMLRAPLTLDQARAWGSWITLSGQMNVVSEFLPKLPAKKLDVMKRTMPQHGRCGRPIDFLDNDPARIWHLDASDSPAGNQLVGAFNWNDKASATAAVRLRDLRLPDGPDDRYVGFDFWANRFVRPFSTTLICALKPSSCRVVSLVPLSDRPQLVSTSRHVSQGLVDLVRQSWDAKARTLKGVSRVIGHDPYEIRIWAPKGFVAKRATAAGAKTRIRQRGCEVRVTVDTPRTRQAKWCVEFAGKK